MKEVKYHKGFSEPHKVGKEDFVKTTREQPPYMVVENGQKQAYAFCPKCDNPVKLLGIYRPIQGNQAPHARHATKYTPIGAFDRYKYLHCPNHRKRSQYIFEVSSAETKPDATDIINLVKTQFDRCIYLISKATGLKISYPMAREILSDYMATPGYLIEDSDVQNIPWIMAGCMTGKNILCRKVKADSPLYSLLSRQQKVLLAPDTRGYFQVTSNKVHQLILNFTNYRFSVREDVLHEYITMSFGVPDGKGTYMIAFEEEIEIDPYSFVRLCHSRKETYRDKALLAISDEMIRK